MALIKCYECGASISDKATSCPHCGAPIKGATEETNNVSEDSPKMVGEQTDVVVNSANVPIKKKGKAGIVIAVIVIAALAVGIVLYFTLFKKASNERIQSEAQNIVSVSKFTEYPIEVAGATRSTETGLPTILYVIQYPGGSSDFNEMKSSERAKFDEAMEELLSTLSDGLKDSLKEKVEIGINVMSSERTYDFLDFQFTEQPEIVAEYYHYADEKRNEQVKQEAADQVESDYNQLIEMAKNKQYAEGMDFYKSSSLSETFDGYSDSKKYFFYCQAMNYYSQTCYGEAYEMLQEDCDGVLDTADVLKEIEDKVFYLDGVYKNESLNYDMYLCIYHGRYYVEMGEKPTEVNYYDTICDYEFTTGEHAFALAHDALPGKEPEILYIVEELSNDKLLVGAAPGASYTTYSGSYKKVSSTPVKAKE